MVQFFSKCKEMYLMLIYKSKISTHQQIINEVYVPTQSLGHPFSQITSKKFFYT